MRIKLIAVFIIIIVSSCTAYSATFDLKAGLVGSGGFGIGGAVFMPFMQKGMSAGVDIKYLSLGGFTGSFYPIELNLQKEITLFDQPVYVGAGLNYLLSSGKQNNTDVQGGLGAQGYIGLSNRLSNTLSMLAEVGTIVTQAKLTGGDYSYSMMGTFSVGLRINPGAQAVAETSQPVALQQKEEIPKTIVPKVDGTTSIEYKLYAAPKTIGQGQPVRIILIPSKGTKIITASAIFENNKKVGFAKKPEPGIGDVWKAYYDIPTSFRPGVHRIKVYLSFSTGETHLKSIDFIIKK